MMKGFFNRIWARKFLRPGRQSGNIEFIKQRASQFSGSNIETVGQILGFVKKMGEGQPGARNEMSVDARRRANVEHILRKNEIGGCGDAAVIFAQLARAKGIPVRLVDAVMKGYDGRGDFRGHVFADVFINDKWITVEPVAGRVIGKGYNRIGKDRTIISYIPYAKGLDFSSMGTTTLKAIRRKSSKFLQPG